MFRFLTIFFILLFSNPSHSSIKEEIINKIEQTRNLSFNFIQTIAEKNEKGNCIIKYSKKIYCEYDNVDEKIIISNGRSLVIKNKSNTQYHIYPLKKTPLEFLLDKDYLISKIKISKSKNIDNKYLAFKIIENDNEINIFFDRKTFNLIGWQTEDLYQNLTITFISSIKINQEVNDSIFVLPKKE